MLVYLRWLAVIGQVATVLYVQYGLGIALPLQQMAAVVVVLVSLNIFSLYLLHGKISIHNSEIFVALLVDVGALTALLYFSGGATNPFISLYLLQVSLGAVLLETWTTWSLVVITGLCFLWLTIAHDDIVLPAASPGTFADLYMRGLFVCYLIAAILLVLFITRINRNVRTRDQHLANLRQQSAEEDHIVRLGLMASGAAHELGTPLATLSVILNDWQHMPEMVQTLEIAEEIVEMQAQVERCKTILSGILMSSGEARGEGTVHTTIRAFFDGVANDWRLARTPVRFVYTYSIAPDGPMIADTALQQIIFNVLDNALEASPAWLSLVVRREASYLVIEVTDRGPGFSPEMLQSLGKPYRSSKNQPGHGLGLFLVVNVVRKLGGSVTASNTAVGGASVKIVLPLEAITNG